MSSWYFCLEPDTLEIVDRFEGTEEDVKTRSSRLEFVKLDAGIDPRVVDITRDDYGNVVVQLNEENKNKINEDVHEFNLIQLRRKRDALLQKCDWTQTNDIGLENEEEWVAYRQALRDLPSLETPIWPEQPQVKIVQGKNIRTELSDIKTELKADLSDTKTNLSETKTNLSKTKTELKADLQTTRTELTEERTLHETTRTQLRNTQTELDVAKIKLLNIEARMQIIESNISKVVV